MGKVNTSGPGSESWEQQALIQWWSFAHTSYGLPELALFAIPNGGRRSLVTGARLKLEGVRPGVPDLLLACPRGSHHGLFVELKRPKLPGQSPRLSPAQKLALLALSRLGYACLTAYGWKEARDAIDSYLSGKEAFPSWTR